MYKSLVQPVVTFGSGSWTLTTEDERRLMTFERRVSRSIYGPVRLENGEYRIRWNHELRDLFPGPDVIGSIKSGRIRWLGHVLRADDDRMVKRALDSKPDGSRPRGRPRIRWIDDVQDDLESLGHRNTWRSIVGDRTKYRRFVEDAKLLHGAL